MKTANFIVDGPSSEIARLVAVESEKLRKRIAFNWLGRELPKWSTPCLIFVSVTDKPWGWTHHDRGHIRGIAIEGPPESIFNHTLPHELTHAVIISHYGDNFPMWANEGMAISSEADCPNRLSGRWGTQKLQDLFVAKEYPEDWKPFYGQSFSVTAYLIEEYGKSTFIDFLRLGDEKGWEEACLSTFKLTLEGLNVSWGNWHAKTFGLPGTSSEGDSMLSLWGHGPHQRWWGCMATGNNPPPERNGHCRNGPMRKTLPWVAGNP